MNVSEEELIEFIKPILKEQGFRKKAKRWTKITEHFTYMFYIQGSVYDKDDYYVRPGVIINDIQAEPWAYGHFYIDIPVTIYSFQFNLSTSKLPPIVDVGVNGFLVPVKNSNEVAKKMIWFIKHPEAIREMGERSHQYALTKFDVNKVNADMIRIMKL